MPKRIYMRAAFSKGKSEAKKLISGSLRSVRTDFTLQPDLVDNTSVYQLSVTPRSGHKMMSALEEENDKINVADDRVAELERASAELRAQEAGMLGDLNIQWLVE